MIKITQENSEHTIKDIKFGKLNIAKIVYNAKTIWERISEIVYGVFNSGRWISNNIWNGLEFWKN